MKPSQALRRNHEGLSGCPLLRLVGLAAVCAFVLGFTSTDVQAATFTVTTPANTGAGSLRAAISAANTAAGADVIGFNIPTASLTINVALIKPTTPLPAITDTVTINGASQTSSAAGDTNTKGPEIEINGSLAGAGADGLTINAADCIVQSLIINGFTGNGVLISGAGATGNKIRGCYLGTDKLGTSPAGNGGSGIRIDAGSNTTIGGITAAARNIISANNGDGISAGGAGSNVIQGNFIGTNRLGQAALANARGIFLTFADTGGNTIGGTVAGARNIISGNTFSGITMQCSNNVLQGNRIGTNAGGTVAVPNGFNGVEISISNKNIIGGTVAGARNIISGNGLRGIFIGSATGTLVQGNFIGTSANGASAVPNGTGVQIEQGSLNTIGGVVAGSGNVISGNGGAGVLLTGGVAPNLLTRDNLVQGNRIGTNAGGSDPVPNGGAGVEVSGLARFNDIGGTATGAGNLISFNTAEGVRVAESTLGNQIRRNRISRNGKLGIDLVGGTEDANGVTENDAQDPDSGPNRLQNRPVIESVVVAGSTVTISGFLNSTPDSNFALEFFRSANEDPSGFGEGNVFVRGITRTTAAGGNVTFSFSFTSSQSSSFIGQFFTATATRLNTGDTSEFSRAEVAVAGTGPSNLNKPSVPAS